MPIISIQRDINSNVSFVKMQVTDNLAAVSQANYIKNNQDAIDDLNGGVFGWFMTDMLLVAANDGNALFQFTDNTFYSLIIYGEQGSGMVLPGLTNNLVYYPANGTTIGPLATANNGVLITSNTGVPSISTIIPSATQLNITNLGTVTVGTWTASVIGVPYGGTGNSTFTAYSVICAGTTATGAFQNVVGLGTAGYLLTSNGPGALPTWQNGVASGIINTGALNDLAYYSTNPTGKTLSAITTADNAVLITSGLGVPNWLANSVTPGYVLTANSGAPPSWQSITAEGAITTIDGDSGSASPSSGVVTISGGSTGLTTTGSSATLTLGGILALANGGTNANLTAGAGKIVYSTASAMALTAAGTSGQLLASAGTSTPVWTTNTYPSTDAKGDILYASAANTIGGLAIGNTGNILTVASGLPAWTTATYPATTTINQILYSSSANTIAGITAAANGVLISSNSNVPSWLANGTAGYALVANTGAPPSWQAVGGAYTASALTESNDTNVTLTLGGTPSTALLQAVSITAGWTGTLSLARGGTAANLTASNGGIFYSTASAGAILSGTATAQQLLMSGASTTPQWSTTTYPLTNAINTIMYASSANVLGVITPVNSAVLVSGAGGVPSMSTTLPSGLSIPGYANAPTNTNITSMTGLTGVLQAPTFVNDTNGNHVVGFGSATPSAVNYLVFQNTATGAAPGLQAAGSDAAVGISVSVKNSYFSISDSTTTSAPVFRLYNSANTHFTGLQAGTLSADTTFKLPVADGSNGSLMQTNGSAQLSFTTATYPATAGTQYNVIQSTGTNFTSATLSSVIDGVFGNAQGDILYRDSSAWKVLAPGTSGYFLQTKGASANPVWATGTSGSFTAPSITVYTSGTGTYTTPTSPSPLYLLVRMIGAGGGGGGGGSGGGNGGTGGNSTFGTSFLTATGGSVGTGSSVSASAAGGTPTGGDVNITGGTGGCGISSTSTQGGIGGGAPFGGVSFNNFNTTVAAVANSGAGGNGGASNGAGLPGVGGGAGGYLEKIVTSPAATYSYAVGAGGTAGTTGTSGLAGAAGGSGLIIITAYFQ